MFPFRARSVFSQRSVQHLLKHYKYCKTALLACPRGRVGAVALRHSEPGARTGSISLLIFIEQGDESRRSGNHAVIATYDTEEGGYKIFFSPPLELWCCQVRLRSVRVPRMGWSEEWWTAVIPLPLGDRQPWPRPQLPFAAGKGCLFMLSLISPCSYRWNNSPCRENPAL